MIGVFPSALYLQTAAGDVIAVATRDAVRLPCAVIVARRSTELPLTSLVAHRLDTVTIGGGRIDWPGPHGPIAVLAVASWAPPGVATGPPDEGAITRVAELIAGHDIGVRLDPGADPAAEPDWADLLGRGPGLTPSGDDVLAGYLIGARAFGLDFAATATLAVHCARQRTTALSAQLLRHAAAGQCTPPLARLVAACIRGGNLTDVDAAVAAVRRIGSTSGTALAAGLLVAAGRYGDTGVSDVEAAA